MSSLYRIFAASLALVLAAISSVCGAEAPRICADQVALGQPDWVRSSVVYEINVRQYSESGTFAAVASDLPRLRALGVDVLWLMPIHPIGVENRKGALGSYYAVKDYYGINPEFGTAADFKRFVDAAHAQGFRVILDWVGNHTAWDHPLTREHPEYYLRDASGRFQPPAGFDWTDVIQLDLANPAVLEYQVAAMSYWIQNYGIDGFRCDFATGIPTPFWEALAARLRELRPDLFLLSESELPQHQLRAFNASYAFEMMHAINAVAQGRASASHIDEILARSRVRLPAGSALLYYTSNHDENSWQGTEFERLGGGTAPFAVLTFLLDGIPLIYNGQEIGLDRRLEFFVRDPIIWSENAELTDFYRTLCQLRRSHPALRTGASMRRLDTTRNDALYAILREAGPHRIVAFLNLTARDVSADVYDRALAGNWRDAFTGEPVVYASELTLPLRAWSWRVLVSQP